MNCVELIFHSRVAWRALSTCCSRIVATLCDRRPLDFKLGRLSRYQVLCLVTTGLDHQALVDRTLVWVGHVSANGARIKRLPRILLISTLDLSVRSDLHHAIDQCLIELILLIPSILCGASWH